MAQHFAGLPMVGTFFFDSSPLSRGATYCSGSVVHSRNQSLVLTAGHCAIGLSPARHAVFVPDYRFGASAAAQPYGIYPVTHLFVDPRYQANTKQAASDLDLAFVRIATGSKGKTAENLTGALTYAPTPRYDNRALVIGYPRDSKVNKGHQAVRCDVPTSRLPGFHQMRMVCGGFYGGVSGGPWITGYNPSTRTGKVIGNVGGYNGGGDDADDDSVSYSPFYGKDATDLFNDADAGRTVRRPHPYRPTDTGTRTA
ncbi:trypsin-like serine peptidase [Streptomyces sp. NPDC020379]|uniref:trypsin-like serine peptidase n=1 Tax=Streptomyces sp. NPDC020379 TaxID=3365071 RepID=UPI0037A8DE83